ncbi:MAG TPA: site-specific integrase [Acidobacteriaceae bacterium]|nr:site-specific integrase [Acidobacteriaceae bacterium]
MATSQLINEPRPFPSVTTPSSSQVVPPLRRHHLAHLLDKPKPRYDPGPPAKPAVAKNRKVARTATAPKQQPSSVPDGEMVEVTKRISSPLPNEPLRPFWSAGRSEPARSFFEQFTNDAVAAIPTPPEDKEEMIDPGYLATISKESGTSRIISSGDAAIIAKLPFREAGKRWIDSRAQALRGGSEANLRHNLKQLNKFFGALRVEEIHIGHIHAYQQARIANRVVFSDGQPISPWTKAAGPSIINHELSVVQQVLKLAHLWTPIAPLYKALQQPESTKPKVMTDAEELHFFAVAASRPDWEMASLVVTITRHTTASGCELRNLRLSDVILDEGTPRIVVNGDTAKNNFRGRVIVLNDKARPAFERCLEMAAAKGSCKPHHYLFPFRICKSHWNVEKPATSAWLRRAWEDLRHATGLPWLTPHCFRHMCITGLLAKGVAPETVRHIAGHVSEEMMRHYSHNRHEDQKAALDTLAPPKDQRPKPILRDAARLNRFAGARARRIRTQRRAA